MKILITGASGFIGQHLVKRLTKSKWNECEIVGLSRNSIVHIFELKDRLRPGYQEVYCDLEHECNVYNLFQQFMPDVIFHLAANPIVKEEAHNPCGITRTNVNVTHHLLAHCKKGTRFVFASSAAVYGPSTNWSVEFNEKATINPCSIYAATKATSEQYINVYSKQGKVSPLILRLVANVGSGATHGILRDQVRKLLSNEPFQTMIGAEPGTTKPFCHVSDTAKAFVDLGMDFYHTGPFNVCPDDSINVKQFIETVMHATGKYKPLKWLGADSIWRGDDTLVLVSNEKIRSVGWKPDFPSSKQAVYDAAINCVADLTKE